MAAAPPVVVVGAGQAGSDTVAALRARGFAGRLTLIGDEDTVPYHRPPLSKEYLGDRAPARDDERGLELRPASFYEDQDIDLVPGDRALALDRERGRVVLASGRHVPYGRLVLATGARPRSLPVPGTGLTGVLSVRGLADARTLRAALRASARVLVIGGGFLGLEIAAAARTSGAAVHVVETAPRLLPRSVSTAISAVVADEHRDRGVRVTTSRRVTALHGDAGGHVRFAELEGGERIPSDLVVLAVGAAPRTRLASDAGLAVRDGILVDARLRTADRSVHAVGDCARFPRPGGGDLRLESVQNAADQARCVAAVICGEEVTYRAVPWFWTDQYALRLQIAGITAGHDRTVTVGDPAGRRFSVLCFRDGRLLGAESVDRPADHAIVRRLLAADHPRLTPDEAARPGFDLKAHQRQLA
ncbi:NAD(P)/FAD-dependent oxidoreductase [Streptomyces sp. NPDC004779]